MQLQYDSDVKEPVRATVRWSELEGKPQGEDEESQEGGRNGVSQGGPSTQPRPGGHCAGYHAGYYARSCSEPGGPGCTNMAQSFRLWWGLQTSAQMTMKDPRGRKVLSELQGGMWGHLRGLGE